MSMIEEQIHYLRELAVEYGLDDVEETEKALNEAADTIESLSAKLVEANKELGFWRTYYINEEIKNREHKDEYIEGLEAADMEQSAEDCGGGWISCKDRLPDKSGEYIVMIAGSELPTCLHFLSSDNSWFDVEKDYKISHWRPFPKPP